MIRSEILNDIAPILRDQLVICNIGIPSQELHAIDDQPTNFYMLGTMGLASSIGLGLALVQKKPVIVIDGDGSVLTNLGTLPTIANNVPRFVRTEPSPSIEITGFGCASASPSPMEEASPIVPSM